MNKTARYKELKQQYHDILKRPIGDRIQSGGRLEERIKQVFKPETAKRILTRSEDTKQAYKDFRRIQNEFYTLREELEEASIITYTEDGEETINE
jgi:hypothetical protein